MSLDRTGDAARDLEELPAAATVGLQLEEPWSAQCQLCVDVRRDLGTSSLVASRAVRIAMPP
jgi:hypothetical protein